MFYKLFLGDICIGPQCEKQCKYKYDQSSADIRIGDLWGDVYKDDEKGVSALVSFTPKGEKIINDLKNVTLVKHPLDIVAEGQMKKNSTSKTMSPLIMYVLRNGYGLNGIIFKLVYNIQRFINVINIKFKRLHK